MDVDSLQPGDLFTFRTCTGHWHGGYEYIGPCADDPDRVMGRDLEGGKTYAIRKDCIVLPSVVGTITEPGDDAGTSSQPVEVEPERRRDLPISAAQRKMIFGLGKSKGLDIDDLRAMTPAGSISALTQAQAAKLIDTLTGKPGSHDVVRGAQGTATAKQIGLIAHLRDQIGFKGAGFDRWLHRQFGVASLDAVADRGLASRVIGGLLGMQKNQSGRRRASGSVR